MAAIQESSTLPSTPVYAGRPTTSTVNIRPDPVVPSGEISGSSSKDHRFWNGAHVPSDFDQANFEASEEPVRRPAALSDRRTEDRLVEPPSHLIDIPASAQQQLVDDWRWERRPEIHVSLRHAAANRILIGDGSDVEKYRECASSALDDLICQCTNNDAQLELSGRELWQWR